MVKEVWYGMFDTFEEDWHGTFDVPDEKELREEFEWLDRVAYLLGITKPLKDGLVACPLYERPIPADGNCVSSFDLERKCPYAQNKGKDDLAYVVCNCPDSSEH